MKMIRLSIALLALLSTRAKAQTRIQAGFNFSNVTVSDNGRIDDAKTLTSFHAGIVGDAKIASILYLQPGLLFTGKGTKTRTGDDSGPNYYKATSNPYYIELPVNLVVKAPLGGGAKFYIGAGPYIAAGISGKNKVEGKTLGVGFSSEKNIEFSNDDPTTLNNEEGSGFGILRRFDYGLNGLAGIEGETIAIGVNYGYGLAKLQSGTNSGANDNNKYRVFSVTLGFKL